MTQAGGTPGKRSVNPPPIISHAPEGFAGAPGPTEDEQRRALYLAFGLPLAVALVLLLVVQFIERARCVPADATDSTKAQNQTSCSSQSSGGHGGGGGGGEGAASFGGFGAAGAGHGGGGGGE